MTLGDKLELDLGNLLVTITKRIRQGGIVGIMNHTISFAEAARRAFDNLSLELQRSAEDDNIAQELQEFLKIMDSNDVDEEKFYKNLECEP
jgi:hypothetical protein